MNPNLGTRLHPEQKHPGLVEPGHYAAAEKPPLRMSSRPIGVILKEAKRLSAEDTERILSFQQECGLRFGDTGMALGVLSQQDIDFALARQFDYPYLLQGDSEVSPELIAAYDPFNAQIEALRLLRSQLMLRCFDREPRHKVLTITSAARGEGRSFLTANLAVMFSQLGQRTLLIDADMRNPRQHNLFGLVNRSGLSSILSGRSGRESIRRIPALIDLSVLPSGTIPPNPQELLARGTFHQLLCELSQDFGVILIDTPASEEYADAQSVAARAGAALVVTRKDISKVRAVRNLVESLSHTQVDVVGTVLNEF